VAELERTLTELGREADWPPTPALAELVEERLRAEPAPPRPFAAGRRGRLAIGRRGRSARGGLAPARRGRLAPARRAAFFRRPLALALLALLLLAGAAFAASPGLRDAVGDLLGVTVERADDPPPPARFGPELGERMDVAELADAVGFDLLVPDALGPPDAAYLRRAVPGGEALLAYRPREGLPEARSTGLGALVGEFRGALAPEYAGKLAPEGTHLTELTVDGDPALWIAGAPHFFFYRDGAATRESSLRLADNVLLVQRGPLLVRIEGAFGSERATEVARSLRAGY
jgi:hypothetical protein